MSLLYSYYGFPVLVEVASSPDEKIFHAPQVTAVAERRKSSNRPGFTEEVDQIIDLTKTWAITGGFFRAILAPGVQVSPSVRSFVLETACLLAGTIQRRRVGFPDWALLLSPGDDVVCAPPVFSPEELAAVEAMAKLPTEEIIYRWVNNLGVDDLSQSLQLYVGEAP